MKYVILIIACTILLLPTSKPGPDPQPPAPVVEPDLLDKSTDVYRQLLSEVWTEFGAKRSTFANDEAALKWINEHQTAAWKAAYAQMVQRAAAEAKAGGNPSSFADALKNRKLK